MAEIIGAYPAAQRAAKSKKETDRLKQELLKEKIAATRRSGKKPYVPGKTAEQMEKSKLYTDILSSIVAGEQKGRFAATTPEIRHFSISDEPQKAKPTDWQYIDPKHLDKLRKMGSPIKSITIEGGGGLSPKQRTAEAYNTLLHGGAERGDPNEIGMLRGPQMSTQQAQQLMATGGTAPAGPQMAGAGPARPGPGGRQPGPDFTGRMPITPPTTGVGGGDMSGMMGLINQQGVGEQYGGTDLTQLFQGEEYVGKPKKATSPAALYKLAQQEGVLPKTKDAKLITVYQVDPNDEGPDTMRIMDTLGPPPEGYSYQKPQTSMFSFGEETLKKAGGEGTETKKPARPGPETDESIARGYWTVAMQELERRGLSQDATGAQIRALAEQLARADGRTL